MGVREHQREYEIEFDDNQWDELVSMSFEPFEFGPGEALTRGQWMALGHMALGKAQRLDSGAYGDNGEDVDTEEWAEELRTIASTIFEKFQAGDGQI